MELNCTKIKTVKLHEQYLMFWLLICLAMFNVVVWDFTELYEWIRSLRYKRVIGEASTLGNAACRLASSLYWLARSQLSW